MLIEVMVAVGLVVLVLVAAIKLTTTSIRTSRVRMDRVEAVKLANSCLNLVREEKDMHIDTFFDEGYLHEQSCDCSDLADVTCTLVYENVNNTEGTKQVYVESYVTWKEGENIFSETASTTFTQVSVYE